MRALVLIAENEANIIESLSFLLKRSGYEIAVAMDGQEALNLIYKLEPRMVILDVMMPVLDGFEVIESLDDNIIKKTKILMLTAKGQEADKKKAQQLGVDRYITKPFSNKEVIESVNELLELS